MFSKAATWYIPALLSNIKLGIKIDKHNQFLLIKPVACTINVYDRRFYDRKLRSSLERKLQLYDRNPSKG
jgi:hypothetical protein